MKVRHFVLALLLPLCLTAVSGAPERAPDSAARAHAQDVLRMRMENQLRRRGLALPRRPDARRQALAALPAMPAADRSSSAADGPAASRALGLIVRWRNHVDAQPASAPDAATLSLLSGAAGVPLQFRRPMAAGYQVWRFDRPMTVGDALAVADRVAALPQIEAAEPDVLVRPSEVSTDPYFVRQ